MPLKQTVLSLLDRYRASRRGRGGGQHRPVPAGRLARDPGRRELDVYGIVAALREAGFAPGSGPARGVVLGAGATASSALAALGGSASPHLRCSPVRSRARAACGAQRTGWASSRRSTRSMRLPPALLAADVVVSTLPAHAADPVASRLVQAEPSRLGVLLDVVYEPRPSALRAAWAPVGADAGGERMLLHQAAEQVPPHDRSRRPARRDGRRARPRPLDAPRPVDLC